MRIKKWLCVALVSVMIFGVIGCTKEDPKEPGSPLETQIVLAENGQTEYKILLSDSPTDTETYAAGELAYFFEEATGATLPIVYDANVSADKNGKFLSIGNTALFEKSKVKISHSELGDDGFKVVTYGNSVLMNGAGEGGKLYAVYDFLEEQFHWEVYAADEIYIDQVQTSKLKDFDIKEIPDFEGRDVNDYTYLNNSVFESRKRMRGVQSSHGNGSAWSPTLWCHSTQIILRPREHMADHRDWFSKNGLDLCYGTGISDTESGTLMRETFLESLKSYILKAPTAKYFMIGLEDNSGFCDCEICMESYKIYGGENERMSGTMLVFVNMIAREVKAWLQETAPERAESVKIGMFAYQASEQAPVTWNAEKGKYECVPEVKPEDNVIIRFAPLGAVFSKPLTDVEYNNNIRETIKSWSDIGAHLSIWTYSCPYGAYLYPFYGWHNFQDNYRIFLEYGVQDVLDQGPPDSKVLPFHALRDYVLAELLWKVDQDTNLLIENFMKNYYKDAAPYMMEYFNLVNSNQALMEKTQGYLQYAGKWESAKRAEAKYYPKAYLNRCFELFDQAYEAIEKIENAETRNLVLRRVQQEELSPRYIELDHYRSYYEEGTLRQMINDFKADAIRLGLKYHQERDLIDSKYETWLNSIG